MACKYASSPYSIVQSADIGRQFAIVKMETKTITAVNLPNGYGMKGNLECMFEEYKARGILTLKLPVRKALTDHIISCPEIFGKQWHQKLQKKDV